MCGRRLGGRLTLRLRLGGGAGCAPPRGDGGGGPRSDEAAASPTVPRSKRCKSPPDWAKVAAQAATCVGLAPWPVEGRPSIRRPEVDGR